MPCDYRQYPKNWKAIRAAILARAFDSCEWCGAPNGGLVGRDVAGEPVILTDYPEAAAAWKAKGYPIAKVVLTIAHLGTPHADGRLGDKHDKLDCRPENLAALCQRCHLAFDRAGHVQHAGETRQRRRLQREPLLPGIAAEANACRALVHCPHGFEPAWHREMAALSGALNRLRREAGLSFAKVDRLAVVACGRKWANFRTLEDYRAACLAVAGQIGKHQPAIAKPA